MLDSVVASLSFGIVEWLWIALILIGSSLLFTAYYFHHQSRQLSHAISDLYNLNQACNQDALDFFDQAWSVLHSTGCVKLQANIEWFGECKKVVKGHIIGVRLIKQSHAISRDDMRFEMVVYLSREAGQVESVASVVMKTFLNILEQNLVLKQAEILTSQKRLERYQLFVQHEIKNIAQFIQLLSEQVQSVKTPEEKVKLIERLSSTIPTMAMRARKTIEHMQQPLSEFYEGKVVRLQDLLNEVVQMYGLNAKLSGDVTTHIPRQILLEVFKNVLGNFRDHPSSEKPLQIIINEQNAQQMLEIDICSEKLTCADFHSERMFEPFWSTSESGMGLGLFLSRELLKQLEGTITFYQNSQNNRFGFIIELPNKLG